MTETEEELSVLSATKSPHGYLTSPLTDNIHMTDEGYLVVVGCPIARTGWQKYAIKDLPQERAADLGVDMSNPHATIELYRSEKEVFHPEFLASLNGKPITNGHPPNGEFVDPKNFKKLTCGHIQNVRKGAEPLEDGEWPIIADLIISDHELIEKVKNKTAREISLGYDFSIDRMGDKIVQCGMMGNHNAVVPNGRAGDFVSIVDAAPEDIKTTAPLAEVKELSVETAVLTSLPLEPTSSVEVIETTYKPIVLPPIPKKEKQNVAETKPKKDWLRIFKGKHLIEMARATDADPEEVLDAAAALNDDAEEPKDTEKNEFKSEDKKGAKDGELPEALKENEIKPKAEDAKVADARKKMHDALDRALDAKATDAKASDSKAKDADIEELKELLDEFLDEEEKEPEHVDDVADSSELEDALKGGKDAEKCEECGEAHDSEECPGEEMDESGEEDIDDEEGESPDPDSDDDQEDVEDKKGKDARANDRARAADSVNAVLRMLRPGVARSNDKALKASFNRALDAVKKSSRASSGSYGAFAGSARARDKAPRNPNPDRARAADGKADPMTKMQEFYNSAHKGGK